MIKVLHIIDSLIDGGKERQLVELLKSFEFTDEVQNEVILLKDLNHYVESTTLRVKFHIIKRIIKKDPLVFLKIRKIIKEYKPDVIHSWGSMPSIYALPFAIAYKIKFLNYAIQNGICKKFGKEWIRSKITFPFSDIILANSYAGIEAYPSDFRKADVVYNGVHLNRFTNLEAVNAVRKKFDIRSRYVVGMVGAFHKRKDYITFFEAAKKILKVRNDVCFVAVGAGGNFEALKLKYGNFYPENIKFLGRQDKVESIINIFDIGVLTTNLKMHREGISNAIIEYMALSKPVIATLGGGTPEIIDNHINGFIIKAEGVDQLKERLSFLLDNEDVRLKFGEKAKTKIEEGFRVEIMSTAFINIYKQLLSK